MALYVEKALIEGSHLVVEAGTGTGKTLAYLYPSLRFSLITGRRIIVSTGTKSLQEQLFYKDVPFLESILGPLNICYMKGRSNYLCRQKLQDIHPASLSGAEALHFKIIEEWAKTTETGDRAEIAALPEKSTLWGRIDARTDACVARIVLIFSTAVCRRCDGARLTATSSSSTITSFLPTSKSR
jgi:ATP-dependent DNA helicase DinG